MAKFGAIESGLSPLKVDIVLPEMLLLRRGGISFGSYEAPATQPRFQVSEGLGENRPLCLYII